MNNSNEIYQIILDTINNLFSNLFSSVSNNIYSTLDSLTFLNVNILNNSHIKQLLSSDNNVNLILIVNSLTIGFLIFYGFKLLFSYYIYNKNNNPFQFILKLIIFSICINNSYFICENIIYLNSILSSSVIYCGESILNTKISFDTLVNQINSNITLDSNNFNFFSFDGLLESYITFGFVNLTFTFAFRYILVQVFILVSPIAFLCLISNSTSWFFKIWLRNFLSLLLIESFIVIVLIIVLSINTNSNSLLTKLLYVSSIYTLLQSNKILQQLLGSIAYSFSSNIQLKK